MATEAGETACGWTILILRSCIWDILVGISPSIALSVMLKRRTDGRALLLRVPGPTLGGAMAVGSICLVVSVHRLFLTVVATYPCRLIYRMFRRRNLRTGTQGPLRLVTRREGATFIMISVHRRTADPLRPLRLEVRPALDRPPAQVRVDHVHVAEGSHVFVVRFVTVFRVSVLVNSVA